MHGNAMFPAIRDGDFCLYAKTGAITQNDVIFYRDNSGQISCGRVVAQGGQTITFGETGGYMIDGKGLFPYFMLKAKLLGRPLA